MELNCSFGYNNERHIDECCCFMPYGEDTYKVWIYTIDRVEYIGRSDKIKKEPIISDIIEKIKANLISTPSKITKLQDILKKDNIPPTRIKFLTYKINNLSMFMEYSKLIISYLEDEETKAGDEETKSGDEFEFNMCIFNDILTKDEKVCLDKKLKGDNTPMFKHTNIDYFKSQLMAEAEANYNIISEHLFGGSYEDNIDKFVLFPINIAVDYKDNCFIKGISDDKNISLPGVFNRLWIENEQQVLCVFSDPMSDIHQRILSEEIPKIKSILQADRPITFRHINVKDHYYTSYNNPGGGIHCLIKQLLYS